MTLISTFYHSSYILLSYSYTSLNVMKGGAAIWLYCNKGVCFVIMTSNLQVFIKSRVFIAKYADIKTLRGRSKVIRPIRQQYNTLYTHCTHTVHTIHMYITIHTLHCSTHTVQPITKWLYSALSYLLGPCIYTALLIFPTYCSLISPSTFVNTRDVTFQPW